MDKAASFPLPLRYIQQEYNNYASKMAWISQEQVLELGCGPGLISRQVLQPLCEAHFARLLAVDRASEAVLYAQQHSHHRDIIYRHVPDLHISVPVELRGAFSKLFHYGGALPCNEGSGLHLASLLLDIRGCCVLLLPIRCCLFNVLEQLSSSLRWKAYMRDATHLVPPQSHWQEPVEIFSKEAKQAGMEVNNVKLDTTEVTFNSSNQFQDVKGNFTDSSGISIPATVCVDMKKALWKQRKLQLLLCAEFLSWAIPFVARIPMENRQAFLDEALALSFKQGVQVTQSGKLQFSITLLSALCTKVRNV